MTITASEANAILETIGAEFGWSTGLSTFPIVVEDENSDGSDGNNQKHQPTGYELRDGNWWAPADLSSAKAFTDQARKYFESFK